VELFDEVLEMFNIGMFHSECLGNPSLFLFGLSSRGSERRVCAFQHAVRLVVSYATVGALLYLGLLCRVQVARLGSVSSMSQPVIYNEGSARCRPEGLVFGRVHFAGKG
jgi:hypothetical protein